MHGFQLTLNLGTFGVVTSYTVKVFPDTAVTSYMNMTLEQTGDVTPDVFVSCLQMPPENLCGNDF